MGTMLATKQDLLLLASKEALLLLRQGVAVLVVGFGLTIAAMRLWQRLPPTEPGLPPPTH